MDARLQEREKQRYLMLRKVYDATEGSVRTLVSFEELAQEAGLSTEDAQLAEEYLIGEGLIEGATLLHVTLTHRGMMEVESSMRHPSKPTEHFGPTTILNFHAPVGVVQNGSGNTANVSQSVSTNHGVIELVRQLHQHLPDVSPEKKEEATELVKALEEEAASEKPAKGKVRVFVEGLKSLLGSPALPLLLELGKKLLET